MSITLKQIEKNLTIRKNFVQFHDGWMSSNTPRERTITISKIKELLYDLCTIRDNKDLIMKNESKNQRYYRFSFIYKSIGIRPNVLLELSNGKAFRSNAGICPNAGMNGCNFQPFCRSVFDIVINSSENFKKLESTVLFPVGGISEYKSKNKWSNPRRWELLDLLIEIFELIIEKSNKK